MFLNGNHIERNNLMANRAERVFAHHRITINEAMTQVAILKRQSAKNRNSSKVIRIPTTAGRRRRRSGNVGKLAVLEPGGTTILRHKGKTPFSAWIAVQRKRLHYKLDWKPVPGKRNCYVVSHLGHARGYARRPEVPECPWDIERIDWDCRKFNPQDRSTIGELLDAYRFSPRRGSGGGLIRQASRVSGVSYSQVRRWMHELIEPEKRDDDELRSEVQRWMNEGMETPKRGRREELPFRRALKAFVRCIADSPETWLIHKIYFTIKPGETAEVWLSRRLFGLVATFLSRFTIKRVKLIKGGSPSLYHITADTDSERK